MSLQSRFNPCYWNMYWCPTAGVARPSRITFIDVLDRSTKEERENLELILKWGCDGSQQLQFKQKFQNTIDSDANIFQSSLVPLRLVATTNGEIIWQDPTPSSVRFGRPVRIRFILQSKDVTREEISYIESQVKNLPETLVSTSDGTAKIKHTMLFLSPYQLCVAIYVVKRLKTSTN